MNKLKAVALLGCGAFLIHNAKDLHEVDRKLDHVIEHTVTHAWEETIQAQREVIDSLLLNEMEMGAKLDSLELIKSPQSN